MVVVRDWHTLLGIGIVLYRFGVDTSGRCERIYNPYDTGYIRNIQSNHHVG